jgi:hypothetical protein
MAATVPPSQPPGVPPPPTATTPTIPWEQPGYPVLEALYETAKLFLTKPNEAFTRMPVLGDLGRPLMYSVIFGWVGMIAAQIYRLAFRGAMWSMLPGMFPGMHRPSFALPLAVNFAIMVLAPILILLGIFIGSAIIHLFLMLVGGANSGFTATMRVVCYSGTTQVLQVIPFCGGLIAVVWTLVLEIVGLTIAHRTTQGKAALAVLLPLALCCACIVVLFLAFGAAIFAAIKSR